MSAVVVIFGVVVGLIWLIFPAVVARGINKQREANRQIVQQLEKIAKELSEMNDRLRSANEMHGDLNGAAQWLVNRETETSRRNC